MLSFKLPFNVGIVMKIYLNGTFLNVCTHAFFCRYLQEYSALGTAGGIYHFRDQIVAGGPEAFFIMNADVCSAFPLTDMLRFQKDHGEPNSFVILGTTVRV